MADEIINSLIERQVAVAIAAERERCAQLVKIHTDKERTWFRQEFDRCAPWIQAALDHDDISTHKLEDIWDAIAVGKAQIWPRPESVVITALEYHPRKVVLRYWLCGGELKDCLLSEDNIEKWAKDAGATTAIIGGRAGWLKALKGYRKAGVYLAKDF